MPGPQTISPESSITSHGSRRRYMPSTEILPPACKSTRSSSSKNAKPRVSEGTNVTSWPTTDDLPANDPRVIEEPRAPLARLLNTKRNQSGPEAPSKVSAWLSEAKKFEEARKSIPDAFSVYDDETEQMRRRALPCSKTRGDRIIDDLAAAKTGRLQQDHDLSGPTAADVWQSPKLKDGWLKNIFVPQPKLVKEKTSRGGKSASYRVATGFMRYAAAPAGPSAPQQYKNERKRNKNSSRDGRLRHERPRTDHRERSASSRDSQEDRSDTSDESNTRRTSPVSSPASSIGLSQANDQDLLNEAAARGLLGGPLEIRPKSSQADTKSRTSNS